MKFPHALLFRALLPFLSLALPWTHVKAADLRPDAGGVSLEIPEEGKVETGTLLSVSFPAAMVPTESIDAGNLPAPLRFEPVLEGTWFWKSQTDGQFTVTGAVAPGQTYAVRLAPGLRDLAGQPVAPAGWGGELKASPFTAETEFEAEDHLGSRPRVRVKFSYPVRLADAAERVYFQDRDSIERRPAEIGLRQDDVDNGDAEGTVLHITPREGLPLGRTFDLVLDGVAEKASGRTLPFLRRIPLGTTTPLAVQWVKAMNLPLEKPLIRVRFDDYLDPASVSANAVSIEPPVPNLKVRASDEDLIAEGDFDRTKHYRVSVAADGVRGRRGFGLAAPARWGATFEPKRSAVFFPGPRIFQRARLGLNFSFLQVHTGPLAWRLAAVPLEKLPAVAARLREFENARKDPITGRDVTDELGFNVPPRTEASLTDVFALPVRGGGAFPATDGEAETLRDLRWQPPGGGAVPAGVYLLEITGPAADGSGKTVGHRSLVMFSDSILTQKRSNEHVFVRVAGMADGLPQAGVKVRAVSASNFELAAGTTDRNGIVSFPAPALRPGKNERGGEPAAMFVADSADGPTLGFLTAGSLDDVYLTDDPKPTPDRTLRAALLTDRNLYRPGQTVKIKGLVRVADRTGERLSIPAGQTVNWTVTQGSGEQSVAQGETKVSPEGGWEAEWNVPEGAKLGGYRLTCGVGDLSGEGAKDIQVQEYKVPLFEVLGEVAEDGGKAAAVKVAARYFSGQPVAGAKVAWRVNWSRHEFIEGSTDADRDAPPSFSFNDSFSEHAPPAVDEDTLTTKGEGKLGPDGTITLRADPPPNLPGVRYQGRWEIAVTSADGQSVSSTQSLVSTLMLQPALLGVTLDEVPTKDREKDGPRTVRLRTGAFDAKDQPAELKNVRVELFRIGTKTVREQVAPFVHRYRNTSVFNPVKILTLPSAAGGDLTIPVPAVGRYVAVAEAPGLKRVSTELLVDGAGEDEVPVKSETSLEVKTEAKDYAPGQTAVLQTRAPVTGVAWVSVETDRILDTVLVPLRGNTSRIEFPVKAEYAPNAHVAVYLVRPGADDRLPAERFGSVDLAVRRPDLNLDVRPRFEAASVRPGQEVRGFVQVSSDGGKTPVAGADVTVYAVDDAILALGDWQAPDLFAVFYPHRPHLVKTYSALRDFVAGIERKSLFQKGFIVGGGGEEFGSKFVRKDFKPLAFWKTGLRSDNAGRVQFAFPAPDNLTRYRLVAVAQTRGDGFGLGSETVEVAKPLIVEPSLPRFLRVGDRVELRAVARQSVRDRDNIGLSCRAEGILMDADHPAPPPVAAERNAPAVFRFAGQVRDVPSVTVSFQANGAADPQNSADAVEVTLPVLPPTILRREATAGALASPDLATLLPDDWRRAPGGRYDVAVSTTPDLGRLRALPAILDYPHGCFEQISSRVLAFCAFNDLLAYLPADPARNAVQRNTIERALRLYDRGVLEDGLLPYWPGGKVGNPFVTVQAAWAVQQAAAAGFDVPADLGERLDKGVDKILAAGNGGGESTLLRAFALLVRASVEGAEVDAEVARSIYANRESLGDEGRALLAVALHRGKLMAEEKRQLLREIAPLVSGKTKERAFNPHVFSSTLRAEAMALLAYATVQPDFWKGPERATARERIGKILDRAALNSTQENLWTLFAFHALKGSENPKKLSLPRTRSAPARTSPNGTAVEWTDNPLGANFHAPAGFDSLPRGAAAPALYYLLNAEYRAASADEDTRRDRGLRVEKVVRNLSDPTRTGQPGAPPVQLNDRLLITYRLQSAKLRDYVALEDELPAGLETINPDLAMFAGFYELPQPPAGERTLELSSSELKDQKTNLYFDRLDPGVSTYSVLARAVAAGTFRWPATQAGPMYEPAVGGLAPSSVLTIVGD